MRDSIGRSGLYPGCRTRKYVSRSEKSMHNVPINGLISVNGGDD
jgi:hypothetical protein